MKRNEIFWLPSSSLSLASGSRGNNSDARSRNHRQIRRRWAPRGLVSIERAVVVFTITIAALIVWNSYRVTLGIYDLEEQQQQRQHATAADSGRKQRQPPGIDHKNDDDNNNNGGPWEALLRRNRSRYHGPPEWIEAVQQSYANGVDNSPLQSTGDPRDTNGAGAGEIHEENPDHWMDPSRHNRNHDNYIESSNCRRFDNSVRRPHHGCQVNTDTKMVFCNFDHLRVDVSKIAMAARGGEELSDVMGREEEDEFPSFRRGAFSTPTKPKFEVPTDYRTRLHYLEDVLNALRYPTKKNQHKLDLDCQMTYQGTTLFLTRYEYVNLYHTLTDWWNTYFVLPRETTPTGGRATRPDRIVFLDGHAKGMLDPEWQTMFGPYHFIQHMGEGVNGGICFQRAIFVPPGYNSQLFDDWYTEMCPARSMGRAFSKFVLDRYGLLSSSGGTNSIGRAFSDFFLGRHGLSSSSSSGGTSTTTTTPNRVIPGSVVIIDRQPFVAHPRSDPKSIARGFDKPVLEKLRRKLESIERVTTVKLVRLETMSFGEQLRLLRETHVLIGIHGAAFSHLLFMDERNSHTIEFREDRQSDFFGSLSMWNGMNHHCIEYDSYLDDHDIQEAVDKVKKYVA